MSAKSESCSADALSAAARSELLSGRYRQGLSILMELEPHAPPDAARWSNIGGALFHLGRPRAAERWLRRALKRDPDHGSARLNLANALTALSQHQEAEALYLGLLDDQTFRTPAARNYASFLIGLQRDPEAEALLDDLTSNNPNDTDSQVNRAVVLGRTGRKREATELLLLLVRTDPRNGMAQVLLGEQLLLAEAVEQAVPHLQAAIELLPREPRALASLGRALAVLSAVEEAQHLFDRAWKLSPHSIHAALNASLLLPVIPGTAEEQQAWIRRSLAGLQSLQHRWRSLNEGSSKTSAGAATATHGDRQPGAAEAAAHTWTPWVPPSTVQPHLFHLAYQPGDVRPGLEAYGDLLRQVFRIPQTCSDNHLVPASTASPGQHSRTRLRIGFASQYFSFHSNSRAFEGLIRDLDRDAFEVVLIHGPSSKDDAVRRRLDATAQQVVQLEAEPARALAQIAELNLQILFYTDLGMNMPMNALAMHRLAPLQLTGWGIPHTSGLRSIDYYISSSLTEPAGAERFYTEQLVRLPALPCCYVKDNLELIEVPRDYFVLPPDGPVLGCLQSLYKLHPDFDLALEQIALANPDVLFVFVESPHASITRRFQERLQKNAPTLSQQMVFLTIMNHKHFVALSNCMDLLLDPFYYCSGITFYESSYTGTPTLTLEGEQMRARYVAAAYRHIGLPDAPIANSVAEYVQLANTLIQNPKALGALRHNLRRLARAHLYDDPRTVRSFEAFCQQAWSHWCHGGKPKESLHPWVASPTVPTGPMQAEAAVTPQA